MSRPRELDRDIRRLALPALGALVAEPLFLLTDTALIGHLGAAPLASLGIATAVIHTVVGLLVFLAYSTTPAVARLLGAGDATSAVRSGISGLWLAVAIGVVLVAVGAPASGWLVSLFGASAEVSALATTYLSISFWGLPALLLTFAATGLLRGLQNTRVPLVIAGVGFAANAALNALFIYGFGWGVGGSALGTAVASWGMAAAYLVIVVRLAKRSGASLAPSPRAVLAAAHAGGWLLLRTASLRAAMLGTTLVATRFGVDELATLQVTLTIFATLAFVLDALAIAGQALIGHGLGASDVPRVRAVTRRLVQLGLVSGVVLGIGVAALSPLLGPVFTSDRGLWPWLTAVALVMAVGIPLAGYVFVLDGVLIGAGDARYLALTGIVNVAVYVPLLIAVDASGLSGMPALVALWLAFGLGYIGARAVTLGLRSRSERWIVVGSR